MRFLKSIFEGSLKIPTIGISLIEDKGYDTPAEIDAVKDLQNFNLKTGPLAEESIVRVMADPVIGNYVFAWINPHYEDPVAVRLTEQGCAQWGFTDDPDMQPEWINDFSRHSLVQGVFEVLKKHRDRLFEFGEVEVTKKLSVGPVV